MKTLILILSILFCSAGRSITGQNLSAKSGEKKTIQIEWCFSFGRAGSDSGEFRNPQAISVDPIGNIYICDTENHRIQKLATSGRFIKQMGGFGWGKEQFYQPMDIQARSPLDIFIADYQNHRIERYDRELNYISSLTSGSTWPEKLQFLLPVALAFSVQRELFIIEAENSRVIKINAFGLPEMSFGDFDWGPGHLKNPRQIEIAGNDRIFISDGAMNTILVYDYFGNFIESWGTNVLWKPGGIFWDVNGFLFVADTGNKQFVIMNMNGDMVFQSNQTENEFPELLEPIDIAIYQNLVYVLDSGKSKIHVFKFQYSTD